MRKHGVRIDIGVEVFAEKVARIDQTAMTCSRCCWLHLLSWSRKKQGCASRIRTASRWTGRVLGLLEGISISQAHHNNPYLHWDTKTLLRQGQRKEQWRVARCRAWLVHVVVGRAGWRYSRPRHRHNEVPRWQHVHLPPSRIIGQSTIGSEDVVNHGILIPGRKMFDYPWLGSGWWERRWRVRSREWREVEDDGGH
jgi:hypothetical protein